MSQTGFHRHLLAERADFQCNIDSEIAVDLKNDAGLNKRFEARLLGLQHVRAECKIGKHVSALLVRKCGSNRSGGRLRYFDFNTGYDCTAFIADSSGNLRRRLRPHRPTKKK